MTNERMKKVEVDVYSDAINAPVMRYPGRSFPGSMIQGDSLWSLWHISRSIRDRAAALDVRELSDEANELFDLLHGRLLDYQATLEAAGMDLPYAARIEEGG